VAEWDDVRRIALALPEASERPAYGNTAWRVRDKIFVWERPLRRLDRISVEELNELIVEAWLCRAPKRLAKKYLELGSGRLSC
jgi:hypothetical protein